MSTSPNLPAGAFITTLGGRRCTALPRTDINTQPQTSTTSTFSTSLIPTTTPAAQVAPQVAPVPAVVENTPAVQTTPAPLPLAATTSASTISPPVVAPSSTSELPLSAAVAVPQPQASVADTSTTALATTVTPTSLSTASVAVVTPTTTPAVGQVTPAQSELRGTDTTSSNGGPFTIIGLGSTTAAAPASTETPVVATAGNSGNRSNGNGSTVAVAGGVIGGVALVSLIAFFIWFWRKQVAKKRRDTLLTPLSADASFGDPMRNEKRSYLIHRDSIGPTARSTKVKAALRAQVGRVRGRFDTLARSTSVRSNGSHSTSRSVDMNRGNSQFLDNSPILGHERNNSTASTRDVSDASLKERIVEMWKRFIGSDKQSLAGDDEKNDIFAARGITGSMRERARTAPSSRPLTNKPDFLTLLNMDDGELDREAQRRRMSRTRGGSEGSGVGGLSLNFGTNPFSDANAISANRPTLPRTGLPVASGANNPFTDAHAIDLPPPKPSTYIDGIRRSRGQSIDFNKYDLRGLHVVNEDSRPPSGVSGARGKNKQDSAFFRDSQVSAASFESFATKRDKFRSDPFDLEQLSSQVSGSIPGYTARPGFNSSSNFSTDAMRFSSSGSISRHYQQNGENSRGPPFDADLARPVMAHTRTFSGSSSKYASGITSDTLDEWSEPGPDVGSAVRYDASRRSSAAEAYNPYSDGNSSQSSSIRGGVSGNPKMGFAL